jgi:hypothetical protein
VRGHRVALILITTGLLSAAFAPGAASAQPPTKAGWWNAASAGGAALPMPATAAGDLHIGQGPTGPSALAAVAYDLLGQPVSSAVLELKLKNAVGTPTLTACVTKDASWKAAENGAIADAPAYDCSKGSVGGVLSATSDTVTFLLDAAQQLAGSYSLAIVPRDGAAPFQVDVEKPGPASLVASDFGAPAEPAPAQPAPAAAAPPAGTGGSGLAPMNPATTAVAPVAPLSAAQAPAVAAPAAPAPQAAPAPYAVAPAAARQPAAPLSNRERYIAGSMLALLAGAVVWTLQQPAPQPRLIGGVGRAAGVPTEPVPTGPPRGIGRFAVVRAAPARRLV